MESAEEELTKCVDYATLDQVKTSGRSIQIIESQVNQEKRSDMLTWLSPLSFDPRHDELLAQIKDQPNAGKWLLDSNTFRRWKETERSSLWYTGKREFKLIIVRIDYVTTSDIDIADIR